VLKKFSNSVRASVNSPSATLTPPQPPHTGRADKRGVSQVLLGMSKKIGVSLRLLDGSF
jgi:hypothetical protein